MFRRHFLALSLGLVAVTALHQGEARADALDTVKSKKVLRVAVPQDFPPFGSVGSDMAPIGYDIDVANLIGKAMGVKVELVPVTSANRIPYLQTNKVDLVISSLGKNEEREKVIDFTTAYAPFYNGVFAPTATKITAAADLSKKTVGVTRGAIEDLELTKIAPADAVLKRYEDNNGTMSAFLAGQVEAIATGNVVAAAIIARNPPKKPEMKFLIKSSPCFVGLNKNEPKLKEAVDAIIAKAKTDGSLDAISKKWLGLELPKDL